MQGGIRLRSGTSSRSGQSGQGRPQALRQGGSGEGRSLRWEVVVGDALVPDRLGAEDQIPNGDTALQAARGADADDAADAEHDQLFQDDRRHRRPNPEAATDDDLGSVWPGIHEITLARGALNPTGVAPAQDAVQEQVLVAEHGAAHSRRVGEVGKPTLELAAGVEILRGDEGVVGVLADEVGIGHLGALRGDRAGEPGRPVRPHDP